MAQHLHILGICGTFMGGIAAIASAAGYRVTGCDANVYPPMSDQLVALGIELTEGFGEEQIAIAPDLWVIGNVVTRGNPLMEAILNRGERYVSGPHGWRSTCSSAVTCWRSLARTARPASRQCSPGSSKMQDAHPASSS